MSIDTLNDHDRLRVTQSTAEISISFGSSGTVETEFVQQSVYFNLSLVRFVYSCAIRVLLKCCFCDCWLSIAYVYDGGRMRIFHFSLHRFYLFVAVVAIRWLLLELLQIVCECVCYSRFMCGR